MGKYIIAFDDKIDLFHLLYIICLFICLLDIHLDILILILILICKFLKHCLIVKYSKYEISAQMGWLFKHVKL